MLYAMKFKLVLLFVALTLCFPLAAQRTERLLTEGWKFRCGNDPTFASPDFNDADWQNVTIPHDWAIYGPFSPENDLQTTAITQDGQTQASQHSGRTGGLPFVGVGWYRLSLEIPELNDGNRRCTLIFDGAMSHSQVYINGTKVCSRPYGYSSFYFDATPYLSPSGTNLIAIRLENLPESSRWYPGAGLYRNVHLILTDPIHVPVWGTQILTDELRDEFAQISQRTLLLVPSDLEATQIGELSIETSIYDPKGKLVASHRINADDPALQLQASAAGSPSKESPFAEDTLAVTQHLTITNPEKWTLEEPALYTSVTCVYAQNASESTSSTVSEALLDTYTTTFGIRTVEVSPSKGFLLNGQPLRFKGVCLHHDLGPLGAAVNQAAIRHRLRLLKDIGANAIRTAHNQPDPELVEACDQMGMLVIAESFDEWETPKTANGYHLHFDQWAQGDITNLVCQFRNSPSVVIWSIGNEIPDQTNPDRGPKIAYNLQDLCHRLDPSRPVTLGIDNPDAAIDNNLAATLDIPGFNYRPHKLSLAYSKLPQQFLLGTETASTVSSRGVYKFPVARASMRKYPDHQASSYDVEHCSWSNLPEDDWRQIDNLPYSLGEFVWTGFDYLGEPTPYYDDWPSHASLFGIFDLAYLPKDRAYLYRSRWNETSPTLHILPHWTFPDRVGLVTPVFVYTSYPAAELFINGVSQGVRRKTSSEVPLSSLSRISRPLEEGQSMALTEDSLTQHLLEPYRLLWLDTVYEKGTLKVIAYDEAGNAVDSTQIHTADKPYALQLTADRATLEASGEDLAFITVKAVDKDGNLCPLANDLVSFHLSGEATFRAVANGDPASLESFQGAQMHLFNGMMTAIVQTTQSPGDISLSASARGLREGTISLQSVLNR